MAANFFCRVSRDVPLFKQHLDQANKELRLGL
jgi:hypothetical protein